MIFRSARLMTLTLSAIIIVGCGNKPRAQQRPISSMFQKEGTLTFHEDDGQVITTISIEISETPQERETGLMGRPSLGEKNGMLFVFEEDQYLSFWMLNTLIPLDMIFINRDLEIITIHRNTVPFSKDSYAADAQGRYVLEVNAGFCDRYGIIVGQKVEWEKD